MELQTKKRIGLLAIVAAFVLGLGFVSGVFYGRTGDRAYRSIPSAQNDQKENIVLTAGAYDFSYEEISKFLFNRLRMSGFTRETIEKRIDWIVFQELLYQEALDQGLANDPTVRPKFRQIAADHLIRKKMQENLEQNPIRQEEIRSYYEQNQQQFHREQQLRTADIFISAETKDAKLKALELLKKAKNTGKRRAGFGHLIKKSSDTPPYFKKGNSGFFDEKGNTGKIPGEYVRSAFSLKKIGDIHPALIQTEAGYHIIMLISRRPALHRSLPVVQNQIKKILEDKKKEEFQQNYTAKLKSKFETTQSKNLTEKLMKDAEVLTTRKLSPPTFPSQ